MVKPPHPLGGTVPGYGRNKLATDIIQFWVWDNSRGRWVSIKYGKKLKRILWVKWSFMGLVTMSEYEVRHRVYQSRVSSPPIHPREHPRSLAKTLLQVSSTPLVQLRVVGKKGVTYFQRWMCLVIFQDITVSCDHSVIEKIKDSRN